MPVPILSSICASDHNLPPFRLRLLKITSSVISETYKKQAVWWFHSQRYISTGTAGEEHCCRTPARCCGAPFRQSHRYTAYISQTGNRAYPGLTAVYGHVPAGKCSPVNERNPHHGMHETVFQIFGDRLGHTPCHISPLGDHGQPFLTHQPAAKDEKVVLLPSAE